MSEYRLHCFAQSGNAYKVALALQLAEADWEPVFVDFFGGDHRGEAFRKMNVMAEVPVLEHRGEALSQSGAILDYLGEVLQRFRPDPSMGREVLRWTLWDNHKLTASFATWRFMINFVPEAKRSADVIGFLEGRARGALKVLDGHLADREWIAGPSADEGGPTTADLSCIGYLFYADQVPIDWATEYPAVTAWRERIAALPGWKHPHDLMPGHPLPAASA
ncbi:MAG: glutathione S-transferase [Pseudomonadota bacterium]